MSKKEVLFVINSLGCGGAEKSLVSLLSCFDYEKYAVDLLMFRAEGMFLPLLPEQVRVLPQPDFLRYCSSGLRGILKGPGKYRKARLRLMADLRLRRTHRGKPLHDAQIFWRAAQEAFAHQEKAYDAAIAWGQGNPTHFVAEKVDAAKKIAVINVNYEAAGHNKSFDWPIYEKYDHIVSVSNDLLLLMRGVYPTLADRMCVIYDIRNQKMIERMAEEFNPYARKDNQKILVTVARLVQPKGYDLAAAACKLLKERGLNFVWYLVGEGPERSMLETYAAKFQLEQNLVLVGAQQNPYPYMKNADVYVQTSRFEGFCLTLCEARILHTPPVSTCFDVVYEQLRDGENGLIVDMTPEAVADGIERMLTEDGLREKIIGNLRQEHLGNETEVAKLYQLING